MLFRSLQLEAHLLVGKLLDFSVLHGALLDALEAVELLDHGNTPPHPKEDQGGEK